jgi:4-amino-4-deoxy-L-arabinose transferase-like glycosyltransferase
LTALGFWTFAGLIALAKGPIGLAILLPTVFVYRLVRGRKPTDVPLLAHPAGVFALLVFAALAFGWPALLMQAHPEAAELWHDQSVGRFLEHWGPQTRPWYYFLYITPWLTLPWAPLCAWGLWNSAAALRRRAEQEKHQVLLVLWFVVTFVLCSVSAGKRAHYILPGLPPLSVLAAVVLHQRLQRWNALIHGWRAWTALAAGYAALFSFVIAPQQDRRASRALLDRNRERLAHADVVSQWGSNDHWTAFPVNRAMHWPRTFDELSRSLAARSRGVVLATENKAEEVVAHLGGEIVDRLVGPRSPSERDPKQALVLITVSDIPRTASRAGLDPPPASVGKSGSKTALVR